jgi:hypothetical protein
MRNERKKRISSFEAWSVVSQHLNLCYNGGIMALAKTKKIIVATGIFVLLFVTTAWATSPRVSWQPEQLIPNSIAPGENAEFVVTLKNTGFLPIPTQQLRVVVIGNAASFLEVVQPIWPPVLKQEKTVNVRLRVMVPEGTPLSVTRGEISVQRILPNGKVKEVLLGTLPIEFTFSLIPLPPDPGEAGKTDLLGMDVDQNGVRDDIDRYIVFSFPDSEKKREGLKQSARELNVFLKDADDKVKSQSNALGKKALNCLAYVYQIFGGQDDAFDAYDKAESDLRSNFLNTPERSRAYDKADHWLGGMVFEDPPINQLKSKCDFDPDSLPN